MSIQEFATELRKWWSFDDGQRENFIEKKLPELLESHEITGWYEGFHQRDAAIERLRAALTNIVKETDSPRRDMGEAEDQLNNIAHEARAALAPTPLPSTPGRE